MSRLPFAAGALVVLLSLPGEPAFSKDGLTFGGICQKLVIFGSNFLKACEPLLTVGPTRDGGVVSIMLKSGALAFDVDSSAETKATPVRRVTISTDPDLKEFKTFRAEGSCRIGDIHAAHAVFTCQAVDVRGSTYRLRFRSGTTGDL
jgi:hypothetical protein